MTESWHYTVILMIAGLRFSMSTESFLQKKNAYTKELADQREKSMELTKRMNGILTESNDESKNIWNYTRVEEREGKEHWTL